ncbi:hypothetical protein ADUPG1_011280 [Aduncisulcus paluster]|uniref:Uncharacterized protein n=1 Tax=Aduncisulcus paluster TaxID=2918883 RepID=A0ABQ5JV07_9EUKA|nr:hypothetical protein ADUPG1_011280 [Aduncisulcus paluster]
MQATKESLRKQREILQEEVEIEKSRCDDVTKQLRQSQHIQKMSYMHAPSSTFPTHDLDSDEDLYNTSLFQHSGDDCANPSMSIPSKEALVVNPDLSARALPLTLDVLQDQDPVRPQKKRKPEFISAREKPFDASITINPTKRPFEADEPIAPSVDRYGNVASPSSSHAKDFGHGTRSHAPISPAMNKLLRSEVEDIDSQLSILLKTSELDMDVPFTSWAEMKEEHEDDGQGERDIVCVVGLSSHTGLKEHQKREATSIPPDEYKSKIISTERPSDGDSLRLGNESGIGFATMEDTTDTTTADELEGFSLSYARNIYQDLK